MTSPSHNQPPGPPTNHPLVEPLTEGSTETWTRTDYGWQRHVTYPPTMLCGLPHQWGCTEHFGDRFLDGTDLLPTELAETIRSTFSERINTGKLSDVPFQVIYSQASRHWHGITIKVAHYSEYNARFWAGRFVEIVDAILKPYQHVWEEWGHPSTEDIRQTNLDYQFKAL